MALRFGRHQAIQGVDAGGVVLLSAFCVAVAFKIGIEQLLAAHDFSLSGQKGQDISFVFTQGTLDGLGYIGCTGRGCGLVVVNHLYGVESPLAFEQGSIEGSTDGGGIDRSRHDQDAQVGADDLLRGACQCKGRIRGEVALMEFVKKYHRYPFQCGVIDQHTTQDALGEHFNAGIATNALLKAYAVSYRLSYAFAQHGGHAFSNLPCS